MNRKLDIFENVLTNPFDNDQFVGFVREFLNNVELVAPKKYNKEYSNFSFYVDGYYHIGNYKSEEGDKIAVFSVCLNKGDTVERARSMQRNFVKTLIEKGGCAGAIVAFYTKEEPAKWRLSFIRMDYEFSKGKVTEKLTPAKRYSYLVGRGEPCHTAKQRLYPIFIDDNNNPSIDDLEEAFSVEKVTNEFFGLYKEKYIELKEYLESNEDFMNEANYRHFTSEQFAKKLMGQIVFLYFIQKKGWLGVDAFPITMTEKQYKKAFFARGTKSREIVPKVYAPQADGTYRIVFPKLQALSDEDEEFLAGIVKGKPWGSGPKDFMRRMFDGCVDVGKNYFDDYLEPLFYTGLNKNRGENGFYALLHRRIPFLNGGLFEQLDNYEWENNNFNIPNELFSNKAEKGRDADGILDIFDRYNFTMNEDEPMECEVAIDPEMLGKVFENLLDVKDRKSKGAFYTPREIVHYMCQETLINHLITKTGLPESDVRDFILYGDLMKDEDTTKNAREGNKDLLISSNIYDPKTGVNRLKELDDILANVKVADLAVGSGAFPLGMLNEIVKARETLSAYMAIGMNNFQKKSFYAYDRKSYDLKVNTIKNCIFACDIEPSAVDIAKLRLWLSIVIDDEIADDAGNGEFDAHTKPRPLPNLDCNIICGNSLIDEFEGNELITESVLLNNISVNSQGSVFQQSVDGLIAKLIELQDKLFFTKEHADKEELKTQIQKIYDDIILEQIGRDYKLKDAYYESLSEPSKPFILWQLYFPKVFKENGGFDIVIGNPPYVGEKGNKEIFRKITSTEWGNKYRQGKADLFYYFYHKAMDLSNSTGAISFITTNYFITATGALKLREDMKNRCTILEMINFNEYKIFESALGQHNMITIMQKGVVNKKVKTAYVNERGNSSIITLQDILNGVNKNTYYVEIEANQLFEGKENFIRFSLESTDDENIINKMLSLADGKLIQFFEIHQGLKTNADKVTDKYLEKYPYLSEHGVCKGDGIFVLTDDELQKITFNDKETHFVKKLFKGSDIRHYETNCNSELNVLFIYREDYISKDEHPHIYNHLNQFIDILKNRAEVEPNGSVLTYSITRPRDVSMYHKEKIVVSYRNKTNMFGYNNCDWYATSDVFYINSLNQNKISLKYLLALLNSRLYYYWFCKKGKKKGNMIEFVKEPIAAVPVKFVSDDIQMMVCNKIDILLLEGYSKEVVKELDDIIYKIYGITEAEQEYIERFLGE